ncbi:MAG: hypothetical protein JNJ73_06785 [Hyphomonadaceae bacterium]|nr:hypothetical protein [Hyphomonadaceae bacterium]
MPVPSKAKETSAALNQLRAQEDVFGLTAHLINAGVEDEGRVRAKLRLTRYDDYVIEHVVALIGKAKAIRQGACVFH